MMGVQPRWVWAYRHVLGLVIVAAVATQYQFSRRTFGVDPVNFFSFFTIQSNLMLAAVWLLLDSDRARAAVTLYLCITGAVYALLLSGVDAIVRIQVPWVNTVLHQVMPLAALGDWVLVPPQRPLGWRRMLPALGYPLLYLGYTLVRGAVVGWYPYPFLDPGGPGGYRPVAWLSLLITAAAALGALGIAWLGDVRRRQILERQSSPWT
jgi:hypothetical protein